MAESINSIIDLIKQGDRIKARTELIALVRQQPNDERVWFLLSLVLDEPEQQRDSLLRVLEINPENVDAQRRLNSLEVTPPAVPEPEASVPSEVESPIVEPVAAPEIMQPEIEAVPETPAESSEAGSIPWLDQGADEEADGGPEAQPIAGEIESPAWMEPSSEPEPARAESEAVTNTADWQPAGNEEIETPDWMSSSSSEEEEIDTPDWMSPASSTVEDAETPDWMSPATSDATEDSETPAWMETTEDEAAAEMPWDVSTTEQPEEAASPVTSEVEDSADTDFPWDLPTPSESQPGELPDWGDDDGSDDGGWMDMPSSRLDFGTGAADLESEVASAVGSDAPESGLLTTEEEPEVATPPDLSGVDPDEDGVELDAGEVTLASLRERSRQREIPESAGEPPPLAKDSAYPFAHSCHSWVAGRRARLWRISVWYYSAATRACWHPSHPGFIGGTAGRY